MTNGRVVKTLYEWKPISAVLARIHKIVWEKI
jgi:hypothetical protein